MENGHSVRALRMGDGWPGYQSCSRWFLCLPSLPQGAAPQVLTGPHLHVLLLGQAGAGGIPPRVSSSLSIYLFGCIGT